MYNVFYSAIPRYVLETLSIVILILLGFVTYNITKSISNSISLVAFMVALQRLLPVMQNVFTGWSGIKGSSVSLSLV